MGAPSTLPSMRFTTSALPPRDAYDAWRERMSVTHEVTPTDGVVPTGFSADTRTWRLGPLVVGAGAISGHTVVRAARRVRTDHVEHYSVLVKRRGSMMADAGGRAFEVRPGEPYVLDMTRPLTCRVGDNDTIAVMLARELLDEVVPPFDMHGHVLRGALGRLLADYLCGLVRELPTMTIDEAPHMARATRDMLAACLAPSRDAAERARPHVEATLLEQARRHIERHLTSRALTPDAICVALGISRSTLYRAFEPRGGVAAHIQDRRLERVHSLLSDPMERRTISEIALSHGFTSETHFSWAFRRRFGYSPRDARAGGIDRRLEAREPEGVAADYHGWIRRLQI